MNSKTIVLLVGAALLATALPAFAATVYNPNDTNGEPSTTYDTAYDGQVYFDGFQASYAGFIATPSAPGALADPGDGLNIQAALLGTWTDCNGDNFVGSALLGTLEYPSALLTGPQASACASHILPDGQVVEFYPIAPLAQGQSNRDDPVLIDDGHTWGIVDKDARVFFDYGQPIVSAPSNPGTPLFPTSQGTFNNGGTLLTYVDQDQGIFSGLALTNTFAALEALPVVGGTIATVQAPYELVVGTAQTAYYGTLVPAASTITATDTVEETYNNSDSNANPGTPLVTGVWNCGAGPLGLPLPGVPSLNPSGSIVPTINEIVDGTNGINIAGTQVTGGTCGQGSPLGTFSNLESSGQVVQSAPLKTEADSNLAFLEGTRFDASTPVVGGDDSQLGLYPYATGGFEGDIWTGDVILVGGGFDGSGLFNHVQWNTYYASAPGESTVASSRYGDVHCSSYGAGLSSSDGWSCDSTAWSATNGDNANCAAVVGSSIPACAVAGVSTYQYRDVDCIDNSVEPVSGTSVQVTTPTLVTSTLTLINLPTQPHCAGAGSPDPTSTAGYVGYVISHA